MSPLDIAKLILDLGVTLASLCGADYDEVMGELHKRTTVNTSELDAASKEMDEPLG